jgi:glycine cleavage system regulatory protein
MNVDLVLTAIGDDRPGLVEALSRVISTHDGSWAESAMSRLGGKFAGIVRVAVPQQRLAGLRAALAELAALRVYVEETAAPAAPAAGRRLHFTLVGQDRVGIVREVAQVLARHAVNVEKLTTGTESAAMSGETLFRAEAELLADAAVDADDLRADLERLSHDLIVDITLDEMRRS